jgi:3-oxoacyl-[acyl-carrier-protein] synthase II
VTASNRPQRRVAVLSASVVTPAGCTAEALMEVLDAGKVLATTDTGFDTGDFKSHLCTRVDGFNPEEELSKSDIRRLPRAVQLAVTAGIRAVSAGQGEWDRLDPEPAIVVGTGIGGLERYDEAANASRERGHRQMSPMTVPMIMPSAAAAELSIRLGTRAPSLTISGACASSALALVHGAHMIRSGRAPLVLAGGSEALLVSMIYSAFDRTGAMARGVEEPPGPFDRDRTGFVMGEGAAFAVLADWDACEDLGIEPIAEILGTGESTDAHHIAAPPADGAGAALSMRRALADADLDAADIGHIAAHATATPSGDIAEAAAIHAVFTEPPPVTAHKGAIGHTLGASGAISAIAAWTSAQRGIVPPIAGLQQPDADLDLPAVQGSPVRIEPGLPALVNAFAFGGLNVSLIVR